MIRRVVLVCLGLSACAPVGSYSKMTPAEATYRAALLQSGAAMMAPPNYPVVYAAPVQTTGPRCYHVMADGRCAHWGP